MSWRLLTLLMAGDGAKETSSDGGKPLVLGDGFAGP